MRFITKRLKIKIRINNLLEKINSGNFFISAENLERLKDISKKVLDVEEISEYQYQLYDKFIDSLYDIDRDENKELCGNEKGTALLFRVRSISRVPEILTVENEIPKHIKSFINSILLKPKEELTFGDWNYCVETFGKITGSYLRQWGGRDIMSEIIENIKRKAINILPYVPEEVNIFSELKSKYKNLEEKEVSKLFTQKEIEIIEISEELIDKNRFTNLNFTDNMVKDYFLPSIDLLKRIS